MSLRCKKPSSQGLILDRGRERLRQTSLLFFHWGARKRQARARPLLWQSGGYILAFLPALSPEPSPRVGRTSPGLLPASPFYNCTLGAPELRLFVIYLPITRLSAEGTLYHRNVTWIRSCAHILEPEGMGNPALLRFLQVVGANSSMITICSDSPPPTFPLT